MCYYGYKFEQYCTGDAADEPVNDRCAYCVTFRTKLGQHRLLLSGEVDCQVRGGKGGCCVARLV
jgi:hypothetical protein